MSPQERTEVRGITFPIIWSVIGGAAVMCATVIGAAVHIERSFAEQSGRVKSLEDWRTEAAPQVQENRRDIAVINQILKIK